jgi:PII-like signaling protein
MKGYKVSFFTQQNRQHRGMPLANWIVEEAKKLGVRGATLIPGREGFGHDGRFHSDSLFGFEDSPLQVVLVLTDDECARLFALIEENQLRIFYTKCQAEFGHTSEP